MNLDAQVMHLLRPRSREETTFTSALSDDEGVAAKPVTVDAIPGADEPLPLREIADDEVEAIAGRIASMHLSDQKNSLDIGEDEEDPEYEAWLNGDNGVASLPLEKSARLTAPVSLNNLSVGDEYDNDDGDSAADYDGTDMKKKIFLDWVSGSVPTAVSGLKKSAVSSSSNSVAAAAPPVEGIWDNIVNTFVPAYLYPATAERFRGVVPAAVAQNKSLPLAPLSNYQERLRIEGKTNRYENSHIALSEIDNVPNVLVYALPNSTIRRSDFFSDRGNLKAAEVKIEFTNPMNNDTTTWRVQADHATARLVRNADVWATKPGKLMLVLRFDGERDDPFLKEFIVMHNVGSKTKRDTALSAKVVSTPAAGTDDGLTAAERTVVARALQGTTVDLCSLANTHTIADPNPARLALGFALASLSSSFASVPLGKATVALPVATAAANKDALEAFKGLAASVSRKAAGTPEGRGELMAQHLRAKLAGAAPGRIAQVMHALGNTYAVFHMCEVSGMPQDAHSRVTQFLDAHPAVRSDKKNLMEAFFL
jgi:hypothetical protein